MIPEIDFESQNMSVCYDKCIFRAKKSENTFA